MKTLTGFTLTLFFILGMTFQSFATVATPSTVATPKVKKESAFKQLTAEEIFTMPRADIEAKIGRKLKFKERLGLRIIQKAYKKASKKVAKKRAKEGANENLFGILGMSFGGLGMLSVILLGIIRFMGFSAILFGVAGIAMGIVGLIRNEPKRILSILGIVLGGLAILALIVLVIILIFFFSPI